MAKINTIIQTGTITLSRLKKAMESRYYQEHPNDLACMELYDAFKKQFGKSAPIVFAVQFPIVFDAITVASAESSKQRAKRAPGVLRGKIVWKL